MAMLNNQMVTIPKQIDILAHEPPKEFPQLVGDIFFSSQSLGPRIEC